MSFTRADYPPLSTIAYVSTVSAGAAFSPASITGCQLWLDGADSTSITMTGSNITMWNDKSGSANHMNTLAPSSGTGLWPTVGTPINGRSTVNFLSLTGIKQSTTLNGVKNLFWVGRIAAPDNTGGGQYYFLLGHDSSYEWCGDSYGSTFMNTTYAQAGIYNASPTSLFTSDARATTNATFSSVYFPTSPSVSLLSVSGITGSTNYQGLCYDRNAHNGWCGDLAEVVIYSTALTTAQRQQVEGYLAWKWGLQTYLPNTHPYYSTNPNAGTITTVTSTLNINLVGYTRAISTVITSTSFSPTSITGCKGWFDASDSTTLTLSAGNVTQWNDKSGTGNNLIPWSGQANATVSSAYQNGLNVLNFSGNSLYRSPAGSAVYPQDVYIIVAMKSLTVHNDVLGMGDTSTDNFNSLALGENVTKRWQNGSSYGARLIYSPTDETSTSFLLIQWSIANNNFLLRRNGTQLVQSASYTYSFNSPSTSIFQIGYRHANVTGTANFNGYIGEMLVYNSQLGTTDRQNVEGYLAWKWGIQASLPGGHPYASVSPNAITSSVTTLYTPKTQLPLSITPYYTSFNPASFSTLALWIDGADPLGTGVAPAQGTFLSSLKDKSGRGYPISTFSTTVSYPIYKTEANGNFGAIQLAAGNGLLISSIPLSPMMTLYTVYSPINPSTGVAIEQGANALSNPGFILTSVSTTSTLYAIGSPPGPSATGGTITSAGGFKYHLFTASGTFTLAGSATISYLIVGGGGGGGDRHGGGGGAGGVVSGTWAGTAGSYTITVGAGGYHGATTEGGQIQYGTPAGAGMKGGNSSISSVATAYGGGGGGTYDGNPTDTPIGSGGGGGGSGQPGIAGTAGQGYAGGSGNNPGGGGGGGAGGAGVNADTGTGGIGTSAYSTHLLAVGYGTTFATSWILGTATYQTAPSSYLQSPIVGGVAYIAGGGGGNGGGASPGGAGGAGGGGRGDWDDTYITGGTTNTGGGGGSSRSSNSGTVGRDGGSGLVLIWYTG